MKKNQLPKQVLNTLLAYQIKSDDILDVCPFDLSFDSEYISGYLFLTSTKIGVAKSRHEQMTVRYFRGTKTADMQYAEDEKEYMLEWFDLADTSHMRVEKQLATNLVTIDYKGKPLLLAALTNLYFEQRKQKKWKRLRIFRSRKHSIVQSVERCTRIQKEKSVRSA